MLTNRTKAALIGGIICGVIAGIIVMLIRLSEVAPALSALFFLVPLAWIITGVLGFCAGALAMLLGRGYVRTLENAVVQGGVAGAVYAITVLIFTVLGILASQYLAAGNIGAGVAVVTSSMTALLTGLTTMLICGIVGGIALAPTIVRIR